MLAQALLHGVQRVVLGKLGSLRLLLVLGLLVLVLAVQALVGGAGVAEVLSDVQQVVEGAQHLQGEGQVLCDDTERGFATFQLRVQRQLQPPLVALHRELRDVFQRHPLEQHLCPGKGLQGVCIATLPRIKHLQGALEARVHVLARHRVLGGDARLEHRELAQRERADRALLRGHLCGRGSQLVEHAVQQHVCVARRGPVRAPQRAQLHEGRRGVLARGEFQRDLGGRRFFAARAFRLVGLGET